MSTQTGSEETEDVLLARAAWSRLIEPGDEVAGALIRAVGPAGALAWLRALPPDGSGTTRGVTRLMDRLGVTDARLRLRVSRAVARWLPRTVGLDPRRELAVLLRLGGRLVVPGSTSWPTQLDVLGDAAPPCLWVRGGDPAELLGRAVSVVGARASTDYGDRVAGELSAGLADRGFTTVSGGAYGIDAAVHRASLVVGAPTVAFLAGGVDRLYPAGNSDLLRAVVERSGLVVSEVPPGSVPSRVRFLKRNRLIAAAGAATVVVEAAWRSGSLATASMAFDLLRPVGAVPGPVTSMASAGCHRLLREGRAVCVTDAAEVLELAGGLGDDALGARSGEVARDEAARRVHDELDESAMLVLDALPVRRGATTDSVVRAAGVSPAEGIAGLGRLELLGLAERDGALWRRSPGR